MRTNRRGFTLGELLIVVAIIGVLVGISIPIFTSQLEKSRQATDIANMRSAKAAAVAEWMADPDTYANAQYERYYDAAKGVMTDTVPEGYGRSAKNVTEFDTVIAGASGVPNPGDPGYITVKIDTDGTVSIAWGGGSGNDLSTPEGRRKEDIDNMHNIAQGLMDAQQSGNLPLSKNYAQVAVFADGTMAYYMDGKGNSESDVQKIKEALESAGLSTDNTPLYSTDAAWSNGYIVHLGKDGTITYKSISASDNNNKEIVWNWWNKSNINDEDLNS